MKFNKTFQITVLLFFCLFLTSQAAVAGVKERMKERLPAIADLKSKGIVGENNRGYLGYVTGKKENEPLVAAENSDRKAVYSYFAGQQNTSLEVVEKVQAQRKAKKAKPGEFIQTPEGKWVKK